LFRLQAHHLAELDQIAAMEARIQVGLLALPVVSFSYYKCTIKIENLSDIYRIYSPPEIAERKLMT
jgi:hypothetical protein